MTAAILATVTEQIDRLPDTDLPVVRPQDRRRAKRLYQMAWGRSRQGAGWPLPDGTETHIVTTPSGDMSVWYRPGEPGRGTVVLAHPDRRYGGHWFVREGWVDALHGRGIGVMWFDQPGYGRGNGGSPFLYENVVAVCQHAVTLGGPVRLAGISLGAFAASLAAAHVPELTAVVLESPYPSFMDWYEGKGMSADKVAIHAFATLFRKSMPAVDAMAKFHRARMPALVAWSTHDTTTPPQLSARVAEGRPDTEVYIGTADHLHLWQEPGYRDKVLGFLS